MNQAPTNNATRKDTAAQTKMVAIVGTNGTGKSTAATQVLNELLEVVPRALVVTYNIDEWDVYPENDLSSPDKLSFDGINWHAPLNVDVTLKRLKYLKNCVIVFDDARNFVDDKTPMDLHRFYIRRRQKGLHILFIAHDLDDVPIKCFSFLSDIVLFNSAPPNSSRLKKIRDKARFEKVYKRVIAKAQTNPHYKERIKF